MLHFDASQRQVLGFDPGLHATVLGAPGTGKTLLAVEVFAEILGRSGWHEEQLVILAPTRLAASSVRSRLERRLSRPLGGTPVRTPASLAFSVLAAERAASGEPAPKLLTGTAHDEAIAEVVEGLLENPEPEGVVSGMLAPEVLRSPQFRAELREFARVLDDFALSPAALRSELVRLEREGREQRFTRAPGDETLRQWRAALDLLEAVDRALASVRPGELTSSGILRSAAALVTGETDSEGETWTSPLKLILVDDAQELGEGELALLAAFAARGTKIWLFGDPDVATGAFHGERPEALTRLSAELARKQAETEASDARAVGASGHESMDEVQGAVLGSVHRHGPELRAFVHDLTRRIGAAGAGAQRNAEALDAHSPQDAVHAATVPSASAPSASVPSGSAPSSSVQFASVPTLSEQLGVIAHRLRRRRLGLDMSAPVPWERMAVICRSRGEVARAARILSGLQVPCGVGAGGVVLREHALVRELIRLLQHALGIDPLRPSELLEVLGGTVGGLDPVAVRRLRSALRIQEDRAARADAREARRIERIIADAVDEAAAEPLVDSAGGRALRRLGRLIADAERVHANGGTARETLWALWEGTRLAPRLQDEALTGRGALADEAHRSLDAVLGLFYALQRHEEQASEQPIADVLDELISSSVPEDTLAARSERDVVTITTPQGALGREFDVVCLLGPQDGVWPNLRARGSLIGVSALERWLRGGTAEAPNRRDTLHDELRLFAQACSRARHEILAVAVSDEDHHPSAFFALGHARHAAAGLPSARLTVRGAVAEMRRRVARDPEDKIAIDSLVALAEDGMPGAHPDDWYGAVPPSTESPLVDLTVDPEAQVRVSPSQMETAERCPLDWVIDRLGGGTSNVQSSLGTLLHRALERTEGTDPQQILETVRAEWNDLPFDAEWESERSWDLMTRMARGLSDYLSDFEHSSRELLGTEAPFEVPVDRALLVGNADRVEGRRLPDGRIEVSVVDLKTGRSRPTAADREQHAQMQAYQLGVMLGAFSLGGALTGDDPSSVVNGGARLLYVHPDAIPQRQRSPEGHGFVEAVQPPLDDDARELFLARVRTAAETMSAAAFTARIEHHCSNAFAPGGSCRLHIIPAVSHA
ncbi:PD-(D/E)XK nuclease family protein [Leucobacter sp. GX24907]